MSKGKNRPGINSTIVYMEPVKQDHTTEAPCLCAGTTKTNPVCEMHRSARKDDRKYLAEFWDRYVERINRERTTGL